MKIAIFATSYHTVSGGDTVFACLAREWINSGVDVVVYTNNKGAEFCKQHGVHKDSVVVISTSKLNYCSPWIAVPYQTLTMFLFFLFRMKKHKIDIVFSMSDTLPDVLPAVVFKKIQKSSIWIVGTYLDYSLVEKDRQNFRLRMNAFIQKKVYMLIRNFADNIITSTITHKNYLRCSKMIKTPRIYALNGACERADTRKKTQTKKYDGIFIGRLHEQKNIDGLIHIWSRLTQKIEKRPKLLIVTAGRGVELLKKRIKHNYPDCVIDVLSEIKPVRLHRLLQISRVYISTSRFDTGSLALDQALACGVPVVVYESPNMPKKAGVMYVTNNDTNEFVRVLAHLLTDKQGYSSLKKKIITPKTWTGHAKSILSLLT